MSLEQRPQRGFPEGPAHCGSWLAFLCLFGCKARRAGLSQQIPIALAQFNFRLHLLWHRCRIAGKIRSAKPETHGNQRISL